MKIHITVDFTEEDRRAIAFNNKDKVKLASRATLITWLRDVIRDSQVDERETMDEGGLD